MPWLQEYLQKDDTPDEMSFEIAKAITAHCEMMSQPDMFYPILDQMCRNQESVVREQAQKAFKACLEHEGRSQAIVPLVLQMCSDEWFTGRMSGCNLIPVAFKHATSKQKLALKNNFFKMCDDKMPLVRRTAAKNISDFARSVPQDLLESEVIPKFESLSIHVNEK